MAKTIHACFRLNSVTRQPGYGYKADGDMASEFQGVKLHAVQGAPFGTATPYGNIEMTIANKEAAAEFAEAPLGTEYDVIFRRREPAKLESAS